MKCSEPITFRGGAFSCGRCLSCSRQKAREWFTRCLLEASQHEQNSVVTLTYDDASLPTTWELQPDHLRDWLKRYRKRQMAEYSWRRVRFYASAEYGEVTQRPHYHVVLFGVPGCEEGRRGSHWCGDCSCVNCQMVAETWTLGASSIDRLSGESIAYTVGYVTRKLYSDGPITAVRRPFQRMSRRPGIGANATWDIASGLIQFQRDEHGVPTVLALGGSVLPLDRFLRMKIAERTDRDVTLPETEKMRAVRDFAWNNSRSVASVLRELLEVQASQLQQKTNLRRKTKL